MPRKKSISGRRRIQPTLGYNIERTNKKLYMLEKANLDTKYSARHLTKSLKTNKGVKVGKRKSRNRIKVVKHLNMAERKYLNKRLQKFLESETSTVAGIKKTRENVRKGFSKLLDRNIDSEDLDTLYDILEDPDFQTISEKIGDSDAIVLIDEFKNRTRKGYKTFVKFITQQKMTANSKETQDALQHIYDKYVK